MPEELKPCPACESKVVNVEKMVPGVFATYCHNKDCEMRGPKRRTRGKAFAAWNALPRSPHVTPNDADCAGCPERRDQGLVWTKEPPTVPGWYWHRMIGSQQSSTMAYVGGREGNLRCKSIWGDRYLTRFKDFEWAGPLLRPEEPVS